MNFPRHKIVLCIIIITVRTNAEKIVSDDESKYFQTDRKDKNTYNVHGADRRFFDNLNDNEWHVAHLKDMNFGPRRSGCKEETFDEKVKQYRKALQNDGSLVEYVSAFQIENDPKDFAPDVCKIPEGVERIFKPVKKVGVVTTKENVTNVTVEQKNHVQPNQTKSEEKVQVDTATTHADKAKEKKDGKDDKRRANDYMFSSDEYYGESIDFNVNTCPDDVIEVVLEIDHIRNYDVECQLMLEWRTLE